MPTQSALSGRSERTAMLSTHSLYATAANGTDLPLSIYRARLHVPEAYSTALIGFAALLAKNLPSSLHQVRSLMLDTDRHSPSP